MKDPQKEAAIESAATAQHKAELTEEAALLELAEKALREWERGARDSAAMVWIDIPARYSHWVFYRCGHRSSADARDLAARMCAIGYMAAPPEVRIAGSAFAADGSEGLYVMCPPEVYDRLRQMRRRVARAKRDNRRAFLGAAVDELNTELRSAAPSARAMIVDGQGREVDPAEVFDAAGLVR